MPAHHPAGQEIEVNVYWCGARIKFWVYGGLVMFWTVLAVAS